MTDDERFSRLISVMGPVPSIGVPRDRRIPESFKNTSAGYTPGIPRLGIPALQSSDASMGVTKSALMTIATASVPRARSFRLPKEAN